jgi:hypothetical protein
MKFNYNIIIGFFIFLFGLFELFTVSPNYAPYFYTFIITGASIFLIGVFSAKGYVNKTFYLTFFLLVIFLGGISIYYLLFPALNNNGTYINIGFFFLFLILSIKAYSNRHKSTKLPWKNEW